MRSRLAGLLALLLLGLAATSAKAQAPLYGFQGANFQPGLAGPMDLAAAVSDVNPNISGTLDLLVQFTNGGLYIFDKDNQSEVAQPILQWTFWCSSTGSRLSGCDPGGYNSPYDTQISYDPATGNWIVAALSNDANGTKGAYLYVGASEGADLFYPWHLNAISACHVFNQPSYLGDNPIMGISDGSAGRVVIDLSCGPKDNIVEDEIFDIDLTALEGGSSIGPLCTDKATCRAFTATTTGAYMTVPIHLRPANNLTQDSGVLLASFQPGPNDVAGLNVWKLAPGTAGITSDNLERFDPRSPQSPSFFYSKTPVLPKLQALAPQPGCSVTSNCAIRTDTLDPIGGVTQINSNGKSVYAVSFAAVAPDGTDSYSLSFILNQSDGTFNFVPNPFTGVIVGYAESALDPDGELVVNRTNFTSTGSHSAIDVINASPISSASVVKTYEAVSNTSVKTPLGLCLEGPCRWGDYTAEVYDPDPACDAVQQGRGAECGLFWTTAEYTDNTTQRSWVGAVKDDVETNDNTGNITFIGNDNEEGENCNPSCDVTFHAPPGVQPGDVLVVTLSVTQVSLGVVVPAGWTTQYFSNNGADYFQSFDSYGAIEVGQLFTYTYGSINPDPGQYIFSTKAGPGSEMGGILLAYRGVETNYPFFTALGFGLGSDSDTVTTGPITMPPYSKLVAVFKDAADDYNGQEDGSGITFSAIQGSPSLTPETGMGIAGDLWTGFAADAWTGSAGGTFGPYSTTASPSSQIALPLAWLVLLSPGEN